MNRSATESHSQASRGRASRRWVVVAGGSRDAYQVPIALQQAHQLQSYVTNWYSPLDTAWFRAMARLTPRAVRQRLFKRYSPDLPSSMVRSVTSWRSVLPDRDRYERIDAILGRHAGRLARDSGTGLLAYCYHAHDAFAAYGAVAGARVAVLVQGHPYFMRRVLLEERDRFPELAEELDREMELAWRPQRLTQMATALEEADHVLVPSTFARRSALEFGVRGERISVVPYGVDADFFVPPAVPPAGALRVVFVGQLLHKKGLTYLLEAWSRLRLSNAELLIVGRGNVDSPILKRFTGSFQFVGPIADRRALRALFQTADLCCVPSLGDGFGHVYLESLACGTPILATPECAAPDLVQDRVEGFIVPSRDADVLAERLDWANAHVPALRAMRASCRRAAEAFTWPQFRRGILEALASTRAGRTPATAKNENQGS